MRKPINLLRSTKMLLNVWLRCWKPKSLSTKRFCRHKWQLYDSTSIHMAKNHVDIKNFKIMEQNFAPLLHTQRFSIFPRNFEIMELNYVKRSAIAKSSTCFLRRFFWKIFPRGLLEDWIPWRLFSRKAKCFKVKIDRVNNNYASFLFLNFIGFNFTKIYQQLLCWSY